MYVVELLRTMQGSLVDIRNCKFRRPYWNTQPTCANMYINRQRYRPVQVQSYSQTSSIKDPVLSIASWWWWLMIHGCRQLPETSNECGNQPISLNRQAATADWDVDYKRQQSTSWFDSRLQEHREWKVQDWSYYGVHPFPTGRIPITGKGAEWVDVINRCYLLHRVLITFIWLSIFLLNIIIWVSQCLILSFIISLQSAAWPLSPLTARRPMFWAADGQECTP